MSNYLKRHPELAEVVKAERGQMIDIAESALKRALLKKEPDPWVPPRPLSE